MLKRRTITRLQQEIRALERFAAHACNPAQVIKDIEARRAEVARQTRSAAESTTAVESSPAALIRRAWLRLNDEERADLMAWLQSQ